MGSDPTQTQGGRLKCADPAFADNLHRSLLAFCPICGQRQLWQCGMSTHDAVCLFARASFYAAAAAVAAAVLDAPTASCVDR